jgi:hypothetical protein
MYVLGQGWMTAVPWKRPKSTGSNRPTDPVYSFGANHTWQRVRRHPVARAPHMEKKRKNERGHLERLLQQHMFELVDG